MKLTKAKLKQIIKEELAFLTDAEEPPMDLYSDYDEDPIKALEKRRAELKKQIVGGNPDAMDAFKEWQNLGSKIAKLKSGK